MSSSFLRTAASRTATAVGAAVIAAVVVAGSLSVAQAAVESVPNNSVNSAKIANNSIQGVDIKDGTVAAVDLASPLRPRWAKISGGPSPFVLHGRGVTSVALAPALSGEYAYLVTFADSVANCGWTATRNDDEAGVGGPGEIVVELGLDPKDLWVRPFDSNGNPVDFDNDDGFTVQVLC